MGPDSRRHCMSGELPSRPLPKPSFHQGSYGNRADHLLFAKREGTHDAAIFRGVEGATDAGFASSVCEVASVREGTLARPRTWHAPSFQKPTSHLGVGMEGGTFLASARTTPPLAGNAKSSIELHQAGRPRTSEDKPKTTTATSRSHTFSPLPLGSRVSAPRHERPMPVGDGPD
jgi:hypothetical protein